MLVQYHHPHTNLHPGWELLRWAALILLAGALLLAMSTAARGALTGPSAGPQETSQAVSMR